MNPAVGAALITGGASFLGSLKHDPHQEWLDKFDKERMNWLKYIQANRPSGPVIGSTAMNSIMGGIRASMQPDINQSLWRMDRFGGVGSGDANTLLQRTIAPTLAGTRADLEKTNINMTYNRDQDYLNMVARLLGA